MGLSTSFDFLTPSYIQCKYWDANLSELIITSGKTLNVSYSQLTLLWTSTDTSNFLINIFTCLVLILIILKSLITLFILYTVISILRISFLIIVLIYTYLISFQRDPFVTIYFTFLYGNITRISYIYYYANLIWRHSLVSRNRKVILLLKYIFLFKKPRIRLKHKGNSKFIRINLNNLQYCFVPRVLLKKLSLKKIRKSKPKQMKIYNNIILKGRKFLYYNIRKHK